MPRWLNNQPNFFSIPTVTDAAEIGPAIARAYAHGGPAVIHVPIEPNANATDKPQYSEFKTWYAEGTQ